MTGNHPLCMRVRFPTGPPGNVHGMQVDRVAVGVVSRLTIHITACIATGVNFWPPQGRDLLEHGKGDMSDYEKPPTKRRRRRSMVMTTQDLFSCRTLSTA